MTSMNESVTQYLDGIGLLDHSITKEYRIFGPPGTGKTTSLTRQIRRAVDRFGDNSVMVTSFSKATAAELAGRDIPIGVDRVGTLHSHCFHVLGKPVIAEVHVQEWNRLNPRIRITPVSRTNRLNGEDSIDNSAEQLKQGDRLLQQLNRCRGMMLEPANWPVGVHDFAARWSQYKAANQLLDFCDLIEISLRDVSSAPNNPAVILVDEAQDLNRMQLALIRRWSACAQYLVLAGDDDQTIYGWAGASPGAIIDPEIPEEHKVFLKQSIRVPRAVYAIAERLIHQVGRRQEKTYLPRPAEGEVHRLSQSGYRSPEYWILKSVERHIQQGKSIMFLASCSYMLRPIIAVLRKQGIPFHNPYRKSNGFWNPLRMGSRHSAASRILALLIAHPEFGIGRHDWRCDEVSLWAEWLRKGVLKAGAMDVLTKSPKLTGSCETLQQILQSEPLAALEAALTENSQAVLGWWRDRLATEFRRRTQFPADIAAVRGHQALRVSPQVVVGTIHSVKGGQADVVYLFPDLSQAASVQYERCGLSRDAVIRVFYVGVTRARETLYICQRETALAIAI